MTSCAPSPALESRSPSRCWLTCRSWARWTAGRSPPWWAWLPSTGTVAPCGANAPSGAGAPECGAPSTWGRCPQPATTPSSATSTKGCWRMVNRRRWPWSRVCANCSSSSTPCSNIALPGAAQLRQSLVIPLDFQHSCFLRSGSGCWPSLRP